MEKKNNLHNWVMNDTTKGEPLSMKTYKDVLKHLKKKNKKMFRHINKSGELFQALVSERMKPCITKNCLCMPIMGMKGNSSSEHLIVVKHG